MATPEHTPLGRGYDSWLGYYQHANEYWSKQTDIYSTGMIDNCINDVSFLQMKNPLTGEPLEGNEFRDLSLLNATFRGGVRDTRYLSRATYEEDVFKEQMLAVVAAHDLSAPLFLFYSFHLLHTPLQVPPSYLSRIDAIVAAAGAPPFDTDNRRLYAAMEFGTWTSPRYPNCSTSKSATKSRGPEHSDVRILEVKIPYGPPRVQDSLTWVFDCGYEPGCLFNLEDDPTEHVDLSPRHADLAYDLAAELAKLNATLFEPVRGTPSLEACLRGIDEGRYYGPWAHVPDGWYTPVPPPSANQRAKDDFLRSMYVGVPLMSFNIIFPTIDTCRSNKSCDSRLPFWPCSWPF
ncbi:hypothetical protein EMIHUDRAFT_248505 [Emiliania huxleyi CCMP1516]|uniref:Sulfatase N-terminal domain-containing protein n=2 Tax=Emiliania huxleyi TaxID=2903 RepID=A0A0D3IFV4_EMIH1|nr:hypothetical protein EMIHUDRAFT_248505 [Emiliania huxleyi CCMP1516]EOD10139.1 hypothetical protein EMIHUDRAFT_248505 [Emiliania huxleyi CCMP1516]|eukprot:XP_005762568.1 hypothetical protein EMIHUDRAFT_248505 [Emiliania huxleyi CCMP1516]